MSQLSRCQSCEGFIPPQANQCPHCQTRRPSSALAKRALQAAIGGAMAMTLMACYGAPHPGRMGPPRGPGGPASGCTAAGAVDGDGDGYCAPKDCNDDDPDIHPGAPDKPGDGVDQSCSKSGGGSAVEKVD